MIGRMCAVPPTPKRARVDAPARVAQEPVPKTDTHRARAVREWTPAAYTVPLSRPFTLDAAERAVRLRMQCVENPRALDQLTDEDDALAFHATALLYLSKAGMDADDLVRLEMRLYDARRAKPQFRAATMLAFLSGIDPPRLASLAPSRNGDDAVVVRAPFELVAPLLATRALVSLRGGTAVVDYSGFDAVARFNYHTHLIKPHVTRCHDWLADARPAIDPRLVRLRGLVVRPPKPLEPCLPLELVLAHAPPCMARALERLAAVPSIGYNATYALVAYGAAMGVPREAYWAHLEACMRRAKRAPQKIKQDRAGFKGLFAARTGVGCKRVRETKGLACAFADIEDLGAAKTACARQCGAPSAEKWSPMAYTRIKSTVS